MFHIEIGNQEIICNRQVTVSKKTKNNLDDEYAIDLLSFIINKALSKKDYDKLNEDEYKEFNDLSTGIVFVRDGLLGDWTGYAPVFKDGNSGLDLSNSRESNIKYKGHAQMGKIMLDFQWNCFISFFCVL